jgi:OOP family OmpA-OmpF porin
MLNKKRVMVLAAVAGLVLASSASAAGSYLGGDLGWGTTHQSFSKANINSFTAAGNNGLAGRIFAGFDVNQYFALESGYTKFSNSTPQVSANSQAINRDIKTYAVDILGKVTLPLQDSLSLFAKLGGAYLNETNLGAVTGTVVTRKTQSKFLPSFGAGVGYDISKSLTTDVSWTRIQATSNTNYLQSTDFVGAGLTYHFG